MPKRLRSLVLVKQVLRDGDPIYDTLGKLQAWIAPVQFVAVPFRKHQSLVVERALEHDR